MIRARDRGRLAERRALRYLKRQGLKLITANYSCRMGEIDLIMRDRDVLVFVEVRARRSTRFGGAAASIDHAKQMKVRRTAEHFLASHPNMSDSPCRFDVIAEQDGSISWLRSAFEC